MWLDRDRAFCHSHVQRHYVAAGAAPGPTNQADLVCPGRPRLHRAASSRSLGPKPEAWKPPPFSRFRTSGLRTNIQKWTVLSPQIFCEWPQMLTFVFAPLVGQKTVQNLNRFAHGSKRVGPAPSSTSLLKPSGFSKARFSTSWRACSAKDKASHTEAPREVRGAHVWHPWRFREHVWLIHCK